ncbi:MAG TPA: hypothetical protein VES97_07245 [Solirubrobacteraceae bacterium]|nr:hypothetical protein [Solirubrobacteraceae bacterium]
MLGGDHAAFASELAATGALGIEASRGTPPPEVLEQMAQADRINDLLHEGGRELRFSLGGDGGRVTIELLGGDGGPVRRLTAGEALDIATGKPLG